MLIHSQRWSARSDRNGSLPKLWGKKRQAVAAESGVAAKVTIVPKSDKTKELIGERPTTQPSATAPNAAP